MRRKTTRPPRVGMAVLGAALLVAGCTPEVHGAPPPSDDDGTSAVTAAPAAPGATDPGSDPAAGPDPSATQAVSPLAGLDARVSQATANAAKSGAVIETVVLDRVSGQTVSNGSTKPFPIASVAKLFIADDLLLQVAKGQTTLTPADRASLDVMLRSSDDTAAQNFWNRSGQNAILARVKSRYGLPGTTAPANGHWDVTQSTAADLVHYYAMLLDGSGGLPPEQTAIIVGDLARSTPSGTDGYPQRFGIPEGLYAEPVAVKQGWFCCWSGSNQLHVTTGIIGADHRYLMALSSLEPTSAAAARETMTRTVKTMFPAGKI